jgi:hypothetical protein
MHFKCYNKPKHIFVMDALKEKATCHWCDMFDFIRYNEFAMARFSRQYFFKFL